MISIGVIGFGYWGPHIVRNFYSLDNVRVKIVCDTRPIALKRVRTGFPTVHLTSDADEVLTSPEIDAVAVVTPVAAHYTLAKRALEHGKHVFIEKPFTLNSAQAEELIELAGRKRLKIMVDHTFLFSGAVRKIKDLIECDALGRLYNYDSTRVNLGIFRSDVNVIWDLASHDLSIMQYLIAQKPAAVVATGGSHVNGTADVAYVTVYFANNMIAHLKVSWLSPVKIRTTLVGGQKKMLVWNDLEPENKITLYDRDIGRSDMDGSEMVAHRLPGTCTPCIEQVEPLKLETQYFVECIEKDETPINDGVSGLQVVRMLEATDASLKSRGGVVCL